MKRIVLVLIFCLFSTSIFSNNKDIPLPTITFVYENYPPYEYPGDNDPQGISADKVKLACRKLGYRAVFIYAPWVRALKLVKTGRADAIFSIRKTKERERWLGYTTPLVKAEDRIFSLRNKVPLIEQYSALKSLSVGLVHQYSYGSDFDRLKIKKKEYSSENSNLIFRLNKGWLDAVVMNRDVFEHYRKIAGLKKERFEMHPLVVNSSYLYIGFSKKNKNWEKYAKDFGQILGNL